jgi:ribonuclease HII
MAEKDRWIENLLSRHGYNIIAGVDEAGRGAIAGPVVASAVVVETPHFIDDINDSKLLKPHLREKLFKVIKEEAHDYMSVIISSREIEELNILQASLIAMEGAILGLIKKPQIVLIDGIQAPETDIPHINLIKGDIKSYAIACASIIAKVKRDRIMVEFDKRFPGYGFAKHKGYATTEHKKAIKELGPTIIHRKTFKPIKDHIDG